jgi:drug/metabolite transporter (DMT)-like permease
MSSGQKPHSATAAVVLAAATFCWATSFPAMRALGLHQTALVPGVSSLFLAAVSVLVRFAVAALALAVWRGRDFAGFTRLEIWQGAGLGFFGGIGILLQMDGVIHIAASTSAFLTQGYCVWVPVVVAWQRREWPSKTLAISCAMVLGGVAVLADLHASDLRLGRGEAETLVASLLFTGQILWLERPLFAAGRAVPVTLAMFAVVALLVLPAALLTGGGPREWAAVCRSGPAAALTVFLTVVCTLVPYTLMNHWQQRMSATQASLIYACEPLLASVLVLFVPAWLSRLAAVNYPNEVIGAHLLLGGGLVIAANLLVLRQASKKAPATSRPAPGER